AAVRGAGRGRGGRQRLERRQGAPARHRAGARRRPHGLPDAWPERSRGDARSARLVSDDADRLSQRVRDSRRGGRGAARRRRRMRDEGPGLRPARLDDPRGGGGVTLTAENTAIVLDSTSDFADAQQRYPNFRVVPLYVLFGSESLKDYVDITPERFYERLQSAPELPTTS